LLKCTVYTNNCKASPIGAHEHVISWPMSSYSGYINYSSCPALWQPKSPLDFSYRLYADEGCRRTPKSFITGSSFPLCLHECYPLGPLDPLALLTVALPLAIPTPRPFWPRDLNIGAFLQEKRSAFVNNATFDEYKEGMRNGEIPQHIWHDKEPHMAPSNVNLIEMRNSAVTGGDGYVLELDVHVVFGCHGRMLG
jgi:hypothetical protein